MSNKCCQCFNPELDALIYQSKLALEKASDNVVKSLYYGYSCDKSAESNIKLLQQYLSILENEGRKTTLGGEACLNCDALQDLAEKVRQLASTCDMDTRRDLAVDRSGVDVWLMQNPNCVSREKWERIAYIVCDAFNIDLAVTNIEEACQFSFEIVRELIPCDVMIALSAFKEACDLNLKVTRTEEECRLDFNILASETNCDLDFKTYRCLVDCNISFDIVKTVYENGCTFGVNPLAIMSANNSYTIEELNIKGIPDASRLRELGINTANSEYAKNPDEFIDKLKQDYGPNLAIN